MGTLVVVRHGETMWNRQQRVQGWAAVGLTDRGHRQAAALADAVADSYAVDRVVSSDLRRTLETARPLARAVDCEPTTDRRWRERDFGVLQGLSYGELFLGHPEFTLTEVGYAAAQATPERGESLLDQRERVLDAATDLVADIGTDETVVVVTHGGPLYLLLGWIKDLDIVATIMEQEQGNCALNELAVDDDGTLTVERENDTEHVDSDVDDDADSDVDDDTASDITDDKNE
ncbi:histidine phosphatase family protein [Halonotius roseus]|uniref:Histidine phosphatase family protein n=1 Tax=Halonotius roseus TaxID=2511997 RepID=A0A544QLZ0_9EURY|nr:histidine phosphatase family protein [Halonotius roseus]TQQ79610.1 histidine phosphatase family protein [Halonotius roseus]